MNCIILAAGRNTRLDNGIPKSLLEVNKETLMARHLRLFQAVGVTGFCIITGYRHEMLDDFFESNKGSFSENITLIYNPEFDKSNGISLNCAAGWINAQQEEDFFFTMADHFFSESFIHESIKGFESLNVLSLVVDPPSQTNSHIDLEDVTKVKVSKGKIHQIGKELTTYDVYDTGLFLAKRSMFNYLQACIDQGGESISNMVQSLASQGKADVFEVNGHFWNDVDTPDDLDVTRGR